MISDQKFIKIGNHSLNYHTLFAHRSIIRPIFH